jgi:hypothetical protein
MGQSPKVIQWSIVGRWRRCDRCVTWVPVIQARQPVARLGSRLGTSAAVAGCRGTTHLNTQASTRFPTQSRYPVSCHASQSHARHGAPIRWRAGHIIACSVCSVTVCLALFPVLPCAACCCSGCPAPAAFSSLPLPLLIHGLSPQHCPGTVAYSAPLSAL